MALFFPYSWHRRTHVVALGIPAFPYVELDLKRKPPQSLVVLRDFLARGKLRQPR
jgi:hypothetical protein